MDCGIGRVVMLMPGRSGRHPAADSEIADKSQTSGLSRGRSLRRIGGAPSPRGSQRGPAESSSHVSDTRRTRGSNREVGEDC